MEVTRDIKSLFSEHADTPDVKGFKLPGNFWLVKGEGSSNISELNAFDNALHSCGISGLNLIPYSSIIPLSSRPIDGPLSITPGSQTGVIISVAQGLQGEKISSGIGISRYKDYYIVFEYHANHSSEVESMLISQLSEAFMVRGGFVDRIFLDVIESKVNTKFGCTLVAVVFDPLSYK